MSAHGGAIPTPTVVLGGGYLGSEVAKALAPDVRVTTRSGRWTHGAQPPGIEPARLDVCHDNPERIREVLEGTRSLVVCYATGGRQDRRKLYLEGGRRVLDALEELPLHRLVYISSTSALPDVDGWVEEHEPGWPEHERGRIQRQAESMVVEACQALTIPWVILRLAGLYGPGRDLGRIYRSRGEGPMAGDGMTATNLIHRTDAVRAVIAALALEPKQSAIVHVCDDDHRSRREMYELLARTRDLPPIRWAQPSKSSKVRGKRVTNRRLKQLLGVELAHPRHVLHAGD